MTGYTAVTPAQARQMMKTTPGRVIIDVREPEEFAQGHIEQAVNIPGAQIGAGAAVGLADKNAPLLVYCHSGMRSRAACEKLAHSGYAHVYWMGGISGWPYGLVQ